MSDKKVLLMLNQPPAECPLDRQLEVLSNAKEAGALLMQDAVFFAATDHGSRLLDAGVKVYALRESVGARGLSDRVRPEVELVSYDRVVDLIMEDYDMVL